MVWTDRWKRYDEMYIRNAIFPCNRGLRVGWMLTAHATTDWQVCRIIGQTNRGVHRIARVRDCSAAEKETLNNLLWTAQIVMRYKPVLVGNPWGLACLD